MRFLIGPVVAVVAIVCEGVALFGVQQTREAGDTSTLGRIAWQYNTAG
jgi:hypothetical protein